MGAAMSLRADEFLEKVEASPIPVLIDFWAEWCGPCKMIAPSVEQIAVEYAGRAKVFKVDVDHEGELAGRFGIMSIPAILVFKDGKLVDQMVGAAPKDKIAALLDRHL